MQASYKSHEWDLVGTIPRKLSHADYGYIKNGNARSSTRQGLIDLVWSKAGLSLVWTPDTPDPVPPETVPFLVEAFQKKESAGASKTLWLGLLCLSIAAALALGFRESISFNPNIVVIAGIVILSHGIWLKLRSLHYTQLDAANDASFVRYSEWLKQGETTGYTLVTAVCIAAASLPQLIGKDAIAQFALVKPAVLNGEVWRLFTAILIQTDFPHPYFLFLLLIPFSKIFERLMPKGFVPMVFLITAVMGNVFSVILRPSTTSAGASGGVIGLLGFAAITMWLDKDRYPRKSFVWVMQAVVVLALIEPFGFEYFDNAAHLGGFVTGVLLGWLLSRLSEKEIEKRKKLFRFAGTAALVSLCCLAGFELYRMFA